MILERLQDFFGDDWAEAVDSIKSTPGAFGNILVGAIRQIRLIDSLAISLIVAGWLWLIIGYGVAGNHNLNLTLLALLPSLLWLLAGVIGGLVFEIGGIGLRSMSYWEAYLLMLPFAAFGAITLRLALNSKDRRVYRGPASDAIPGGPESMPGRTEAKLKE